METSLAFQQHPDDDIWEEYSLGRLEPPQEAAMEEHLLLCEACRVSLLRADNYIRSMKMVTADFASSRARTRRELLSFAAAKHPARIAALAAMALAAVVLWLGPIRPGIKAPTPAAADVALESVRAGNSDSLNHAPAKRPLELSMRLADVPDSPHYRMELVDSAGRTVWHGTPVRGPLMLSARIAIGPPAGIYWVRLYGDSPELLAEYGLRLE